MKTIHKSKKCKTCKEVVSNGVMIRDAKKHYYCNSECFGGNVGWLLMDGLIEFVEIREKGGDK